MIKISVIILIKNGEEYIKYLDDHFESIEEMYFNKYIFEYFIYENNSKDNTKNAIKTFYTRRNRNGKYLLEDIDINKDLDGIKIERGEYMCLLRNKLKTFHGILNSKYSLFIDCDVIFSKYTIEKMVNTFQEYTYFIGPSIANLINVELPTKSKYIHPIPINEQDITWNDTFDFESNNKHLKIKRTDSKDGWAQPLEIRIQPSNSIVALSCYDICYIESIKNNDRIIHPHYYDSFAFISNKYISYKDNDNTCMFTNCIRCSNHRKLFNINLDPSLFIDDKNIIDVESAFGGFFLLKTQVYNIINWDSTICEHHSFCEKIRVFGDILLDPRIKVITLGPNNKNYREIQQIELDDCILT
jgi:hypothetical protein